VRAKSSLSGLREHVAVVNGDAAGNCSQASGVQQQGGSVGGRLAEFEQMMGTGATGADQSAVVSDEQQAGCCGGHGDELGEKEMFSKLVKPRVRYDVEVVTKLVVYSGTFLHLLLMRCMMIANLLPRGRHWMAGGRADAGGV